MKTLVAVPVYNEQAYVEGVLRRLHGHAEDVLVVDDASSDDSPQLLTDLQPELGFELIRHPVNHGYGARSATRSRSRWGAGTTGSSPWTATSSTSRR